MQRSSIAILLFMLLIFLGSCGGSNKVMDTGLLQKRKHLPGWDLSLRSKKSVREVSKRSALKDDLARSKKDRSEEVLVPLPDTSDDAADVLVLADTENTPSGPITRKNAIIPFDPDAIESRSKPSHDERIVDRSIQDPERERIKKRWNKFAIPAFLAALGTIYLGLFGLSTIAVLVGLVVTFTLSGISLWQIRVRDEAGKGFALIALILGLLAALATAMVTYVVGFV